MLIFYTGKGELIVETTVFYNPIRAAVRTFTPKEEIIMKEQDKFEISLLQRDVKRITAQVCTVCFCTKSFLRSGS